MKSIILALATLVLPLAANAAAQQVKMPLQEERVFDQKDKLCFYSVEINLGDMNSAKPFQILRETDENKYETMKFSHYVYINKNSELILKVSSSGTAEAPKACEPSQSFLFLN